jgi:undecaprenyl-phosphate 4-deoxy-4-formamido-L-arabinose transferase
LFRNLGSAFNDKMANVILHKPADLYLASFKAINRFLVNEIVKYQGPDPYIDAIILRTTTSIGKVEVRHDERKHGRSGYTLKKLVSLWGNMVVSYSLIPLRVIGLCGLLMTLLGIIDASIHFVHDLYPGGFTPTDFDHLSASMLCFRGFVLLAIGILGEYVGRIYLLLNADPQFVIREKFALEKRQPAVTMYRDRQSQDRERKNNAC